MIFRSCSIPNESLEAETVVLTIDNLKIKLFVDYLKRQQSPQCLFLIANEMKFTVPPIDLASEQFCQIMGYETVLSRSVRV